MLLSVLVILLLSMLYEAIKTGKAVLLRRALLALPRGLSRESLVESEEGNTHPAQGRYLRGPWAPPGGGCLAPGPGQKGRKAVGGSCEEGAPREGVCVQPQEVAWGYPGPSRSFGRCPGCFSAVLNAPIPPGATVDAGGSSWFGYGHKQWLRQPSKTSPDVSFPARAIGAKP